MRTQEVRTPIGVSGSFTSIKQMCGTPQAQAPERGTGPKEPVGRGPEEWILWAQSQSIWLFPMIIYAIYHNIKP